MIKVLMVGNHPSNKGGMTSVIGQIRSKEWTQEGIELTFIPTYFPGNPIKKVLFFGIAYFKILIRFFFNKPDIVHMHMSYKGSFTRKNAIHKLCKLFRVKDIIHLHGSEFEKWYYASKEEKRKKIKRLLSECDRFIVLGEGWKNIVNRIEPAAPVTIINNGIEIPEEMVSWNDTCCQVLFLGVLIPRKGLRDLVKAVSILKDTGKIGILHFVIAGTGEEESVIKNLVKEAGVDDFVSFAGWVSGDKKKELLLKSQVLISTSYNEGLPISILEAASYGLPIVSTDVGDISSVVKNGINGFLFEPGDVDAIIDALKNISCCDRFKQMSIESRKIIESTFSIELFYRRLMKLYQELGDIDGE